MLGDTQFASAAGGYRHPFDESWFIPANGEWGNTASWRAYPPHAGVDYNISGGSNGKTIRAIGGGVIRSKGYTSSYGNRVYIQHDDGMWSHYAHMQSQSIRANGEWVAAGTPIGFVGDTGAAPGAYHLHLEVSRSQAGCHSYASSLDPIRFINNNGSTQPAPGINPVIRRNNNMSSLYYTTVNGVTTFALAGDGSGSAAWLETADQAFANALAGQHGTAAYLTPASFSQWKSFYLS